RRRFGISCGAVARAPTPAAADSSTCRAADGSAEDAVENVAGVYDYSAWELGATATHRAAASPSAFRAVTALLLDGLVGVLALIRVDLPEAREVHFRGSRVLQLRPRGECRRAQDSEEKQRWGFHGGAPVVTLNTGP